MMLILGEDDIYTHGKLGTYDFNREKKPKWRRLWIDLKKKYFKALYCEMQTLNGCTYTSLNACKYFSKPSTLYIGFFKVIKCPWSHARGYIYISIWDCRCGIKMAFSNTVNTVVCKLWLKLLYIKLYFGCICIGSQVIIRNGIEVHAAPVYRLSHPVLCL